MSANPHRRHRRKRWRGPLRRRRESVLWRREGTLPRCRHELKRPAVRQLFAVLVSQQPSCLSFSRASHLDVRVEKDSLIRGQSLCFGSREIKWMCLFSFAPSGYFKRRSCAGSNVRTRTVAIPSPNSPCVASVIYELRTLSAFVTLFFCARGQCICA